MEFTDDEWKSHQTFSDLVVRLPVMGVPWINYVQNKHILYIQKKSGVRFGLVIMVIYL